MPSAPRRSARQLSTSVPTRTRLGAHCHQLPISESETRWAGGVSARAGRVAVWETCGHIWHSWSRQAGQRSQEEKGFAFN